MAEAIQWKVIAKCRRRQMAKLTERELLARDSKRNLGAELLASVREMKAGKASQNHRVVASPSASKRKKPT
jgi:putative transcriptional regulator